MNGVAICDDALGERAEWTVDRGGDPWGEVDGLLLAHDFVETIDQVAGLKQWWDILCDLAAQVRALKAQGIGPSEIAKKLGIGRASVYKALA